MSQKLTKFVFYNVYETVSMKFTAETQEKNPIITHKSNFATKTAYCFCLLLLR